MSTVTETNGKPAWDTGHQSVPPGFVLSLSPRGLIWEPWGVLILHWSEQSFLNESSAVRRPEGGTCWSDAAGNEKRDGRFISSAGLRETREARQGEQNWVSPLSWAFHKCQLSAQQLATLLCRTGLINTTYLLCCLHSSVYSITRCCKNSCERWLVSSFLYPNELSKILIAIYRLWAKTHKKPYSP